MSPSPVLFGPKGVPRLDLSEQPGKSRVGGGGKDGPWLVVVRMVPG